MAAECFRDLAFIVPQFNNNSLAVCLPAFHHPLQTVLFTLLTLVLLFSLVHALYGAYLTKNKQARYQLLCFSLPTFCATVICGMVAGGETTGEHGKAIVIWFGFYLSSFVIVLNVAGLTALKKLALISLKSLHLDQQSAMFKSPRLRLVENVMGWLVVVTGVSSVVFLSILFPIAPDSPLPWGTPEYYHDLSYAHQRRFYWDVGTGAPFIPGCLGILASAYLNLHVIITSLEKASKNIQDVAGSGGGGSGARDSMQAVIRKLKFGKFGVGPAGSASLIMGILMLYSTGVGPSYYLLFVYFACTTTFAQFWAIVMYHPVDLFGLQRRMFGSKSSGGTGGTGSKHEQRSKSSKSPLVSGLRLVGSPKPGTSEFRASDLGTAHIVYSDNQQLQVAPASPQF